VQELLEWLQSLSAPWLQGPSSWIDNCSDHRLVYLLFKQPQNIIHKNPCLSKLMELVPVISLAIGIQQVALKGLSRKGGGKGGGGESPRKSLWPYTLQIINPQTCIIGSHVLNSAVAYKL
jgi:hypothetical protein